MSITPVERMRSRRARDWRIVAALAVLCMAPASGAVEDELKPTTVIRAATFSDSPGPKALAIIATYRTCHLEFSDAEEVPSSLPAGIHAFRRFDRFVDAFVADKDQAALDALEALRQKGQLRWFELGGLLRTPPPPPAVEQPPTLSGGVTQTVRNGLNGLKGRKVLLAVIDSGIDYRHPDFWKKGPDGVSRSKLVAYWDTIVAWREGQSLGKPGPIRLPDGRPLGVVYETKDLDAALKNPDILPETLKSPDPDGHGTACAGLAAGYGHLDPDQFAGVAPETGLIAVRIGDGRELPNSMLLNAICNWLDELASGRPLVVSCSFGGQFGCRDGQSVFERHLNEWLRRDKPGRVVCIAAGNEGGDRIHAGLTLAPGASTRFLLELRPAPPGAKAPLGFVELYTKDDNQLSLLGDPAAFGGIYKEKRPLSDCSVITLAVHTAGELTIVNGLPAGTTTGKLMPVDIYLSGDIRFSEKSPVTFLRWVENRHLIAFPGSTERAITVGSFDFRDRYALDGGAEKAFKTVFNERMRPGEISTYSNGGPLRLHDMMNPVKPTVASPGQWQLAPAVGEYYKEMKAKDAAHQSGLYALFNGTSAATPYVAGILALVMETRPDLTQSAAEALLRTSATPRRPSELWGSGRLDFDACSRLIKANNR